MQMIGRPPIHIKLCHADDWKTSHPH